MKKRRIRFKPRFWAILAVVAFAYISLSISGIKDVRIEKTEYVVQSGDTLWEIAEEYSSNDIDVREYIGKIIEDNDLKTLEIYPDMVLEIERVIK